MPYLLLLLALPSIYVATLLLRWRQARGAAQRAIDSLHRELGRAKRGDYDPYDVQYQCPELMFQVIEEIEDLALAAGGTMLLMQIVEFRKRMRWNASNEFRDIVSKTERGIQALKDASFFSQFPAESGFMDKAVIHGISARKRLSAL